VEGGVCARMAWPGLSHNQNFPIREKIGEGMLRGSKMRHVGEQWGGLGQLVERKDPEVDPGS